MPDDLNLALQYHQHGQLEEAARLYRIILGSNPNHADALHLLGLVAYQRGDAAQAVDLIGRAIALVPSMALFHANLAEAYRSLGELNRAVGCCRTALRLQPNYAEAANNLGLALQSQGNWPEATAQFRAAVRLRPDFALAHNNLGNALRCQGDAAQALVHFRQAVELDPTLAEAHTNLGQFLLELHELPEALEHCRTAVRLRPDLAEGHNNLGNLLREQGQLEEAKASYAEALRLNPTLAMTYNNMGQALQEENKLAEAVAWYQQALQRDPNSARIHSNLASALAAQERYEEALARYDLALRLDPSHAEAHSGLGFVLHEQGHYETAAEHYRAALLHKADFAPAHANLGTVLAELGRLDEACACFRAAIKSDPTHAACYAQLATLLRAGLPETEETALRRLLVAPHISDAKRYALHFGLAHLLDARGAYAQAAEHLRAANTLCLKETQKLGKGYHPQDHRRFVDALIASFTPEFFARVRGFGLETERPLFIVGLPRSGTTLLEQILASHSQVFGAGELPLACQAFDALPGILNIKALPVECIGRLDSPTVRQVAQRHLDQLAARSAAALRIVDKMPDNYLYLGLIFTMFPRAKLIHCRRQPRDVAVSCWMTNFRHIRWANDPEHIAGRFHEYQRLMEHWRRVLPVEMCEVDYEETVADLEGVARRLSAWAGLAWEPACLSFHTNARPVRTASVSQVRRPLYKESVERWQHYVGELDALFRLLPTGGFEDCRGFSGCVQIAISPLTIDKQK